MKERRKPEYLEKTPDDKLQKTTPSLPSNCYWQQQQVPSYVVPCPGRPVWWVQNEEWWTPPGPTLCRHRDTFLVPEVVVSGLKVSFTTWWLWPLGSSWTGTVSSPIVGSGVFEEGVWGGGGGEGREQGAGMSFGNLHFVEVFCTLVIEAACVIYLSIRLSSGPQGGHPHARLKAGTPHEALTPVPTTKTPVPTTVNRRRSNAESTNLQNYGEEGRLCHPWSPTWTLRGNVPPQQPSWSRHIPLVRINMVTLGRTVGLQDCSGETCSLSEETRKLCRDSNSRLLPQGTNMAGRVCHTPVDRAGSVGACCPFTNVVSQWGREGEGVSLFRRDFCAYGCLATCR